MYEFPNTFFKPKDARHTQSNWSDIIPSANFGLVPLDLYNVRKVACHMLRDFLETRYFTVSVPRGGKPGGLNYRFPSTCDGAKGVSESYIFSMGEHCRRCVGVSFHELAQRLVIFFNHQVEIWHSHNVSPQSCVTNVPVRR